MGQITLDHVTKEFGSGEVRAVDDVNLTIGDGEFMVLVGPSGCGKTTLLRSIGGLEKVTDGRILIGDRDVTRLEPGKRDLAMVFQNYALYPHMTVRQNLGYGLRVRKTPRQEREERVQTVAKLLGLDELLNRRPGQLSGGQQQRVAMGRAIVREPAAYLMDEPLSNLDAKLRVGMRTSLQQLHKRLGTTTVYVTHDQVEAMTLGQRVAVMRDGRMQQVDAPQKLYDEPRNVFVAAFIGSPAMNLVETDVGGDAIGLGGFSIPLARERRPRFARSGHAIVGIRPEAFEDSDFAPSGLPQIDVRVHVLEELGSDVFVFFEVDAAPVTVEGAVTDEPEDEAGLLAEERTQALFAARVDARTKARVGEMLRLSVDPSRLYFFSPRPARACFTARTAARTSLSCLIRHPEYTRARLRQTSERLQALIYPEMHQPDELLVAGPVERITREDAQELDYRPARLGERFGPLWSTHWFRGAATVPDDWGGSRVDLVWDSASEATLWLDGLPSQGLNRHHRDAVLVERAAGGERVGFEVELACNDLFGEQHAPYELHRCELGRFDADAWRLALDFEILRALADEDGLDEAWAGELLSELNRFCNVWPEPEATAILAALYERRNATTAHELVAVGHAHLDTAWLWPLAETYRKAIRTFTTQARYLREYPDYRFACSQAQQYAWIEETPSGAVGRDRGARRRGRLGPRRRHLDRARLQHPLGRVAPAAVPPRPAVLRAAVRPALHGVLEPGRLRLQRPAAADHARGRRRPLPDAEALVEPLQPARAPHVRLAGDRRQRGAGALPAGRHVHERRARSRSCARAPGTYKDHEHSRTSMLVYGHGDGGGGPTREMIETMLRARDLQGLPRTSDGRAEEFFEALEAEPGERPTILGELYFEYHRGTYTTQARTKRGNRRAEIALHDAEFLATVAGGDYPRAGARPAVEAPPPAAVPRHPPRLVHPARLRGRRARSGRGRGRRGRDRRGGARGSRRRPGEHDGVRAAGGRTDAGGRADDRGGAAVRNRRPGRGRACVESTQGHARRPGARERAPPRRARRGRHRAQPRRPRHDGREALAAPGNRLELYDDRPVAFEAWDIDPFHLETRRDCPPATSYEVVTDSPLRAEVAFERAIGEGSTMRQVVRLDAGSRRLEFHTEIDWHEERTLLKICFPLAVRAPNATYEMQFGYAERPTHYSTSHDRARYEVPGHRFADLSEHGFGVAVLTDCKYGYSCYGNELRISLLRASKSPDPGGRPGPSRVRVRAPPPRRRVARGRRRRRGGAVQPAAALGTKVLFQHKVARTRRRRPEPRARHDQARRGLGRGRAAPLRGARRARRRARPARAAVRLRAARQRARGRRRRARGRRRRDRRPLPPARDRDRRRRPPGDAPDRGHPRRRRRPRSRRRGAQGRRGDRRRRRVERAALGDAPLPRDRRDDARRRARGRPRARCRPPRGRRAIRPSPTTSRSGACCCRCARASTSGRTCGRRGCSRVSRPRSPARPHVDMVFVRENTEGEYSGVGGRAHQGLERGRHRDEPSSRARASRRVVEHAFKLAERRRGVVTSATKSNASRYGYVLWDEVAAGGRGAPSGRPLRARPRRRARRAHGAATRLASTSSSRRTSSATS